MTACTGGLDNVQVWGGLGSEPGQFNEPFDVAVDQQGFVYVTDVRNKRVQKFSADGDFLMAFGQEMFEKPGGIGIGPDGTVWVTDYNLDRIFHFNDTGKLIAAWACGVDVSALHPDSLPGQMVVCMWRIFTTTASSILIMKDAFSRHGVARVIKPVSSPALPAWL